MVRAALRQRFLERLEAAGGNLGNIRLRETLGWQDDTYWTVRAALIDEGIIQPGRGRGGSVTLCDAPRKRTPSTVNKVSRPLGFTMAQMKTDTRTSAAGSSDKASGSKYGPSSSGRRTGGVVRKSDLYSSLWASCDELRGGMDPSQYKDYVLFMLFIKYVSDKYGDSDDFAPSMVIPPGASFKDMVTASDAAARGSSPPAGGAF
jgi:type I restriction enzyme M protein